MNLFRSITGFILLMLACSSFALEATLTQGSPTSATVKCDQGYRLAYVYRGTFDGATAVLQSQDDDDDWNDVPDTSDTTANGGSILCFTESRNYRLHTTAGGASESVEIELEVLRERPKL